MAIVVRLYLKQCTKLHIGKGLCNFGAVAHHGLILSQERNLSNSRIVILHVEHLRMLSSFQVKRR